MERPKYLEKRPLSGQIPQSNSNPPHSPVSLNLRRRGRVLEINSSLFSGDTSRRVWGSSSTAILREGRRVSKRDTRESFEVFLGVSWRRVSVFFIWISVSGFYYKDNSFPGVLPIITKYYNFSRQTQGERSPPPLPLRPPVWEEVSRVYPKGGNTLFPDRGLEGLRRQLGQPVSQGISGGERDLLGRESGVLNSVDIFPLSSTPGGRCL